MKTKNIDDPTLGTLTFDPRAGWYETKLKTGESSYSLAVESDENCSFDCALESARAVASTQDKLLADAKSFAVSRLLQLKNDTWLGEDEEEVSSEDFQTRMAIDTIVVHGDGSLELYFNDDDLFWSHTILVSITKEGKYTSADIAG